MKERCVLGGPVFGLCNSNSFYKAQQSALSPTSSLEDHFLASVLPVIPPGTGFPFRRLLQTQQGYGGGTLTRLHTGTAEK
jgi:hypothetical protein